MPPWTKMLSALFVFELEEFLPEIGNWIMVQESAEVLRLSRNMRLTIGCKNDNQQKIKEFSDWLLKVGDGLLEDNLDGESKIDIPMDMIVPDYE
ncbi:hypothetical protein Ahy_B09g099279 isoform B [Arachis hypogaea]|uniref:ATP-dependent DNA helicase n=1 Tax=Arachis hypogaea TaxID=3818 RepID=A0A444XTH9_ARAHY|nr:hypothetical protein Ahy_B09g099279 isoform B [Arachis hypogaea]